MSLHYLLHKKSVVTKIKLIAFVLSMCITILSAQYFNLSGQRVLANCGRSAIVAEAQRWVDVTNMGSSNHHDLINYYNSQLDAHPEYLDSRYCGYANYNTDWCAIFVSVVAMRCNATDVIFPESACWVVPTYQANGTWVENDAYVPAPGDLIFYNWDDSGYGDCTGDPYHVGIVESCDGSTIVTIEGNTDIAGSYPVGVHRRYIGVNSRYIRGFAVPRYGNDNRESTGFLDSCTASDGSITITGWAYDPDAPDQPIYIHAYVGGPSGSGEGHNLGVTNVYRDDVNNLFGLSGNHGFSFTFSTNLRGSQPIYIYGLDSSGNGPNPIIAENSVNIPIFGESSKADLGADFYAVIQNRTSGTVLQNTGIDHDPSYPARVVQGYALTGNNNQIWHFTRLSDGSYKIVSVSDGYVLEVRSGEEVAGQVVAAYSVDNGTPAQKWNIYRDAEIGYYLQSECCSNMCLDLAFASTENGGTIQINVFNTGGGECFNINRYYHVVFKDGNNIVQESYVPYGTSVTPPALSRSGYTLRWTGGYYQRVTNDITVNANWQRNQPTHTHSLIHVSASAPSCTTAGNIEYWRCQTCNRYYSNAAGTNEISASSVVVSATGHTVVVDPAVAPTATTTGLTEGSHCSVCGQVIVAQNVIPASGSDAPNPIVEPPAPAGTVNMYRLYNPNSGEHFYTSSSEERDMLIGAGWNYEGIGWIAPANSNTPVYRLYNQYGGEHHYTTSISERDMLVNAGWSDEGIGWYSDDNMTVPLYRQYNPNAFANNHNYTTSLSENNWLISLGWRGEGIGWYGVG